MEVVLHMHILEQIMEAKHRFGFEICIRWWWSHNIQQVEVEVVLHNLELVGVDLDQPWVVEAENTGRV